MRRLPAAHRRGSALERDRRHVSGAISPPWRRRHVLAPPWTATDQLRRRVTLGRRFACPLSYSASRRRADDARKSSRPRTTSPTGQARMGDPSFPAAPRIDPGVCLWPARTWCVVTCRNLLPHRSFPIARPTRFRSPFRSGAATPLRDHRLRGPRLLHFLGGALGTAPVGRFALFSARSLGVCLRNLAAAVAPKSVRAASAISDTISAPAPRSRPTSMMGSRSSLYNLIRPLAAWAGSPLPSPCAPTPTRSARGVGPAPTSALRSKLSPRSTRGIARTLYYVFSWRISGKCAKRNAL